MLFLNVSFMLGKKKNNIEIINGILENLTVLKIISQFYFSNFNLNILTYIYIYIYIHATDASIFVLRKAIRIGGKIFVYRMQIT